MRYTIKEIMPTQIAVKFEDGSKAVLYIDPQASPEDIDDAVSYYDPDFRVDPEILINKNISVGEERISVRREELSRFSYIENHFTMNGTKISDSYGINSKKTIPCGEQFKEVPNVELPQIETTLCGELPLPKFNKDQIIISYVIADYFIKTNDDYTLKNELDKKIEEYITSNKITVDKVLESLMFEDNDFIVRLAEEQLDAER